MKTSSEITIYKTNDGATKVEVRMEEETVWLTQQQMTELFQTTRTNVVEHIQHIYNEGELSEKATCRKFRHVRMEGSREVSRELPYYNLDMIISLGYRVKSAVATQFRIWATKVLREYMIKGFSIDDERLKEGGGGNYWKELLDRIRDIRSSEKALYRQVLDLYETSTDYDPKNPETIKFFKTVQNKLHYATSQQTAAELIHSRADSDKDFMGLTTFAGVMPRLNEVKIAKNYLTEEELFVLNRLVAAFFDLAEIRAQEHKSMRMADWVAELDKFSGMYGKGVLEGVGKVSHKQAEEKAIREYRKYQAKTLSPIEKEYLGVMKELQDEVMKKLKNKNSN